MYESLLHKEVTSTDSKSDFFHHLLKSLNVCLEKNFVFHIDTAQREKGYRQALHEIVLLSRKRPDVATAASNAITILNGAGEIFSTRDLRYIFPMQASRALNWEEAT